MKQKNVFAQIILSGMVELARLLLVLESRYGRVLIVSVLQVEISMVQCVLSVLMDKNGITI